MDSNCFCVKVLRQMLFKLELAALRTDLNRAVEESVDCNGIWQMKSDERRVCKIQKGYCWINTISQFWSEKDA